MTLKERALNLVLIVAIILNAGVAILNGQLWMFLMLVPMLAFFWISAWLAAKPEPNALAGAFATLVVWCQWRFLRIRRVDISAFAEMVENEHGWRAVPIDLWVTGKGVVITTQALVEELSEAEEKEAWQR